LAFEARAGQPSRQQCIHKGLAGASRRKGQGACLIRFVDAPLPGVYAAAARQFWPGPHILLFRVKEGVARWHCSSRARAPSESYKPGPAALEGFPVIPHANALRFACYKAGPTIEPSSRASFAGLSVVSSPARSASSSTSETDPDRPRSRPVVSDEASGVRPPSSISLYSTGSGEADHSGVERRRLVWLPPLAATSGVIVGTVEGGARADEEGPAAFDSISARAASVVLMSIA
jgi:hypothetical protein